MNETKSPLLPNSCIISICTYSRLLIGYKLTLPASSPEASTSTSPAETTKLFSFPSHLTYIKNISASPCPVSEPNLGSSFLISSGEDEQLHLFSLRRLVHLGSLVGSNGEARAVEWMKNSAVLGLSSGDIAIYRTSDWALLHTFPAAHKGAVVAVSSIQGTENILSLGEDRHIRIWALGNSPKLISTVRIARIGEMKPSSVEYVSGYAEREASILITFEQRVKLFSSEMKELASYDTPCRIHKSLHPTEGLLLLALENKKVQILSFPELKPLGCLVGHGNRVKSMDPIRLNPGKLIISTISSDGCLRLFDLTDYASGDLEVMSGGLVDTGGLRLIDVSIAAGPCDPEEYKARKGKKGVRKDSRQEVDMEAVHEGEQSSIDSNDSSNERQLKQSQRKAGKLPSKNKSIPTGVPVSVLKKGKSKKESSSKPNTIDGSSKAAQALKKKFLKAKKQQKVK